MSAIIPRELMILVERVVRPQPIPLSRQKRLRTEFLEHLQAIYAEELARDGDAAAALTRTQQRFGDPEPLTAELRSTIRWWERWESWSERNMAQKTGETAARYAVRMTMRFTACVTLLWGLILLDHHVFGTERASLIKIQVGLAALTALSMWLEGFLLFGLLAGVEWERPHRRWGRMFALALGLAASWPISLVLLMHIANGTWSDYSAPLMTSFLGGVFSVLCGITVGVRHHRDTAYRREWARVAA